MILYVRLTNYFCKIYILWSLVLAICNTLHSLVNQCSRYHLSHMSPYSALSARLSCIQWPLMSGLAQTDCNYLTGGASSLINTLTSSSQPTRVYSTTEQGSDNFIPHLSPCVCKDMHSVRIWCICVYAAWHKRGSTPLCTEEVNRDGEARC